MVEFIKTLANVHKRGRPSVLCHVWVKSCCNPAASEREETGVTLLFLFELPY